MKEPAFGWMALGALSLRLRAATPVRSALDLLGPAAAATAILLATALTSGAYLASGRRIAAQMPAAYDLLVRPQQNVSPAERALGLIAPREREWGAGITVTQWRTIAAIPAVSVAAPIAIAGTLQLEFPAAGGTQRGAPPEQVTIPVVGVDPSAEARLLPVAGALRFGTWLTGRIDDERWLAPPLVVAASWRGGTSGSCAVAPPAVAAICSPAATLGGGITPPRVLTYTVQRANEPNAPAVVAEVPRQALPALPSTASAWLSVGGATRAPIGGVDIDRLRAGGGLPEPLPLAPYVESTSGAPTLLTDVRAVCRLVGDGCIAAVRIKLRGPVTGARGEATLAATARRIAALPGLSVDITAGASQQRVEVPNDRPVDQLWPAIGASLATARGVSSLNLLLLGMIGSVALLYATAGGMATGLRRAPDLRFLADSGWPAGSLRRLLILDAATVAVPAGLLATAVSIVAVALLGIAVPMRMFWLVGPLSTGSSLLGAAIGYRAAARPGEYRTHSAPRAPSVRTLPWWLRFALAHYRQHPLRAALAALIGGAAAAIFTLLALAVTARRDALSATVLGHRVAVELAPYHAVLAAVAAILAVLAPADLAREGVRERRFEIGVLRAVGWSRGSVVRLIVAEAGLTGICGSLLGTAAATLLLAQRDAASLDRPLVTPVILAVAAASGGLALVGAMPAALLAARIAPAEATRDG